MLCPDTCGPVAQWLEQRTHKTKLRARNYKPRRGLRLAGFVIVRRLYVGTMLGRCGHGFAYNASHLSPTAGRDPFSDRVTPASRV